MSARRGESESWITSTFPWTVLHRLIVPTTNSCSQEMTAVTLLPHIFQNLKGRFEVDPHSASLGFWGYRVEVFVELSALCLEYAFIIYCIVTCSPVRTFLNNMSTVALPLNSPVAKEWLLARKEKIRPWSQFLDVKMFHIPTSFPKCTTRVVKNVEYFQSNYIIVFIGLIVYCILTSPLLLIAIAALLGSCYIIKLKNETKEIALFGQKLTLAHQYALVSICAFPLFYLAGAGQVVFWILGASFFFIMLHATLYEVPPTSEEEELKKVLEIV
ncbi:prenylated Rab acceptor protein 1 [Trichonephila inaurata madagascariensis]|uniref:PRA1 family protein n=1 Tax=Trichonephila inaurata madagascariensis TaxID=2747483 RepID=A0A8X6Y0X2_9ARAC|nr:prenylated Rab acceptor protein 1 [Trichonephila inaurata madagascariensis]